MDKQDEFHQEKDSKKDSIFEKAKKMVDSTAKKIPGASLMDVAKDMAKDVAESTGKAFKDGGKAFKEGLDLAGKGTLKIVQGGLWVGGKLYQGSGLIKDKAFREKFGLIYFREVVKENFPKVKQEILESKELALLLWKISKGQSLDEKEKEAVIEQLKDIARVIPALGIFALPGGLILLPLLAKALPWEFFPSSFRPKSEKDDNGDNVKEEEDEK